MAAITPTDRPYMRTGVIATWKKAHPWLLLLMISATFTGSIINSFEDALAASVVLHGLHPDADGYRRKRRQSGLGLVVRGLSLGEIEYRDVWRIIWKRCAWPCSAA